MLLLILARQEQNEVYNDLHGKMSPKCPLCIPWRKDDNRPFNCQSCAAHILEPHRREIAELLLEKELLGAKVEAALQGPAVRLDQLRAEIAQRTESLSSTVHAVFRQLDRNATLRSRLFTLRDVNTTRRVHLSLARKMHASSSALSGQEMLSNETRKLKTRIYKNYIRTIEARKEVVGRLISVHGLQQRRHKRDGARMEYVLGGVVIPSMLEMPLVSRHQVNAAMTNLSHFLILLAGYLGIKLPHEPLYPFPEPRIRSSGSPPYWTHPLTIPTHLTKLYTDDSARFNIFIEGYALLCHNVAFLCFTQGLTLSLAEALNPAASLYRLLVLGDRTKGHALRFGHWSHTLTTGYLGGPKGQEALSGWELSLWKVLEKVSEGVTGMCEAVVREEEKMSESAVLKTGWTRVEYTGGVVEVGEG